MAGALPDSPVPGHPGPLAGGGELGALVRAKDWSATPLGPPGAWSRSVAAAVSLCLNSRFPMVLLLGPELRLVYNDAYAPFLGGAKHPAALGAPGREAWAEIWETIGPLLDEALAGEATWAEDLQLFFDRRLPREEVYFTFSYSPILGEDGRTVEGVFCACTETTGRVVGERRLSTLRGLGLRTPRRHTAEAACRDAAGVLDGNPWDIPFAAIYLNGEDGRTARLVAGTRLPDASSAFPAALSGDDAGSRPWPFGEAARTREAVEVPDLPDRVGVFAAPLWPDPVQTALVIPVPDHGTPEGFLVVGTSPRRVLDADYRAFLGSAAEHIAAAVAEVRAFEGERRRAEALAELDRAETAFSNVGHEFRAPLTLERLRVSEERFRRFAEHSTAVLWIADVEAMRLDYLSPAFGAVAGRPPEAALGDLARWAEAVHPDDRTGALEALERVRRGEVVTQEYRIVRPDGAVRWLRDTCFPIRDERGRVRQAGGIAQDVTKHAGSLVYVVDADGESRRRLSLLLRGAGYEAKAFASGRAFLEAVTALVPGCVVLDTRAPAAGGLAIPRTLKARRVDLPVIVTGGSGGDVGTGVQAMKAGAVDWLEAPCEAEALLPAVASAMAGIRDAAEADRAAELARARVAAMSAREREVLDGLLAGGTSKTIARDLGISPRTVETHRTRLMERLGARTLPEAVLMAAAAGLRPPRPAKGGGGRG